MRGRTWRICVVAAAATTLGCTEIPFGGTSEPIPVVQMLLAPGRPTQFASVTYGWPVDSVVPAVARGVPPDEVSLVLETTGGVETALRPVAGASGEFAADVSVTPGQTVRLRGAVLGRPVSAAVTVPGAPQFLEPAVDSIRVSDADYVTLPYRLSADGAAAYVVRSSDAEQRTSILLITNRAAGTLPVSSGRPDTTYISVRAYDPAAASFFLRFGGESLEADGGVVVGFGATAESERPIVIIWGES